MWEKYAGLVSTYGIQNVLAQGYEKKVINPRRYQRIVPPEETYLAAETPSWRGAPPGSAVRPWSVFFVVHTFFPDTGGGTERFVLQLAQNCTALGYRVRIFAYASRIKGAFPRSSAGILYAEDSYQGIPVVRFRHRRAPKDALKGINPKDADLFHFAEEWMKKERPDLVHNAYSGRTAAFLTACRQLNIPYVVTLTDLFLCCHYATMIDRDGAYCNTSECGSRCGAHCKTAMLKDYRDRYAGAKSLLEQASAVTAPSVFLAGRIQREFGVRSEVIRHGIAPCATGCRTGPVRSFVFVGKICEEKGVFLLIQAFCRLKDPSLSLKLYGDGEVSRAARAAKRDPRIRIMGAVAPERIGEVYQSADCVVVPSLVPESYSFVLHEALQSGCFTVASALGALPETLTPSVNGFLCAPGSEESLLSALRQALTFDWAHYRQTSFPSPEEETGEYQSLYDSILDGRERAT